MSLQAAVISNTIASMKKAVTRRDDASDSDDSISQPTNRGNKLKRKARYVREGQLDLPNGPRVYKRKIEHAGYTRSIISRNPRRYDDYGNELEDEELDQEADAIAAAENPYGDIRLEHTLAPLTSASELTTHPALSQPYLSNILTKMAEQAANMVHQERATLWRTKELLTKFRDETWIPCGAVETDHDISLFGPLPIGGGDEGSPAAHEVETAAEADAEAEVGGEDEAETQPMAIDEPPTDTAIVDADVEAKPEKQDRPDVALDDEPGDAEPTSEDKPAAAEKSIDEAPPADLVMADPPKIIADVVPPNADPLDPTQTIEPPANEVKVSTPTEGEQPIPEPIDGEATTVEQQQPTTNGVHPAPSAEAPTADAANEPTTNTAVAAPSTSQPPNAPPTPTPSPSPPPAHRMTTRARLNPPAPSLPPSPTPPPTTIQIHPLFLAPSTSLPDPDFGLPPAEAEETRRLLLSYVQKQEEVCRGAERLYAGLLRADRMRRNVWEWARQSGHEGEMSDGEDWVDGRRWGLDDGEGVGGAAGLKKGVDEEEGEDAGGTGGGKRTRRRGV